MTQLWITWEKQRRNLGISTELGFSLHEILSNYQGIRRYLDCASKTIDLIRISSPTHVAVQNPSIVLALLGIIMKKFYGFTLVVDSHNAGLFPLEGKSVLLNSIAKFIQKSADFTIVSNNKLGSVVEINGGIACVLPDRIPEPHCDIFNVGCVTKRTICFICTYARDEPYVEVIKAVEFIPNDINIVITGRYNDKVDPAKVPNNVKLLGFLPEEDYWTTIASSSIIMDLTTRENCLVCGAYEGVSLRKPLILSNTQATKKYFYKGCVYVDPNAKSIAAGIIDSFENIEGLIKDIGDLRQELDKKWEIYSNEIKQKLYA